MTVCVHSLINPRCACTARVTVVGCVCVKSHLTSGASVRPENTITYSGGEKICGVFSETAPLQKSSTPFVEGHVQSAILLWKTSHAYYCINHVAPRVLHFSTTARHQCIHSEYNYRYTHWFCVVYRMLWGLRQLIFL